MTPLVSKDGMVSAFGSSNTLLLIDSRANIDRIVTILEEVDSEGTPGILRFYPLSYAVAADVAKTLTTVSSRALRPPPRRPRRPRPRVSSPPAAVAVKFLPDARTNSVIVCAGQEMQDDVADLLKKIDVPASAGSGRINVYYLGKRRRRRGCPATSPPSRRSVPAPHRPSRAGGSPRRRRPGRPSYPPRTCSKAG